ncbi:unnamed protein product [Spirodela intermedia]|uniref:Uncharacterized protein n=1 Tax=Spirodela intermedia TaxID=51605 RepID=A0A7I8L2B7_SPIIN|nr:unnamed protein product [Spirodela intermedia]
MCLWRPKIVVALLFSWAFISLTWASFVIEDYEGPRIGLETLRSEEEISWLYDEWLMTVDRTYEEPGERQRRFEIFKDNLLFIDEHNHPKNNHTYTIGLNELADLSYEEYQAKYLIPSIGENPLFSSGRGDELATEERGDGILEQVPDFKDWRIDGSVSAVINQGSCGKELLGLAAAAAVEGLHHIRTGQMIRVSAQQLVDCDSRSLGCVGGWQSRAISYIQQNGGVDSAENYPYTGKKGVCRTNSAKLVSVNGWKKVPEIYGEMKLKQVVAAQPVAVATDALNRIFQLYKGGVFNDKCNITTNHVMAVVGYGVENGQDYWLVKNSWGFNWGENGYVKMARNINQIYGLCGIVTAAIYPW